LAKTIKGWTLGPEIEARNATHQIKKMTKAQLHALRDRLYLAEEIPDAALEDPLPPYFRPSEHSEAHQYLMARQSILAGPVPVRRVRAAEPATPDPKAFAELLAGSGTQAVSTTMAFARLLRNLARDPKTGPLVAPIVADEARTFGLESFIAESKIYAPEGQRYAESTSGQLLQEGITEAGALATFAALSTSYATWGKPMLPVFLFYSMFGFQRVGDLAWAVGDMRGRGILAGCTAGRTTLQGEGLQHDDGHSPLLASTNPAARIYDPAFAYELAIIVQDAVAKILGEEPEDHFCYLTLYNEAYSMPALPEGPEGDAVRAGVLAGLYRFAEAPPGAGRHVSLLFSGVMWQAAAEARQLLADEWGVGADTWSVTSWTGLRADALAAERHHRLHPGGPARVPVVTGALRPGAGPVVAITDYMRSVPDQVARFVPRPFVSLGTDGFGLSDARPALRRHFEVDTAHVVVAALAALADQGQATPAEVADAIVRFGIDPERAAPFSL
jgi:pyruvate dehydrogenase E1 component